MQTQSKIILGIDFNNLLIGSFFGQDLINTKGINVNAIKGFFTRLARLRTFIEPDYIVIANDLGRHKTFRRKLYEEYKATRVSSPDGVREQLKYGLELCYYLGYPVINNEEYEADDILGMISRFAIDNDMEMVMATSDRDYYQLITDKVSVFNTRKSEIIDLRWITSEYGLTPLQLIEVKALAGDRGDNIPGVRGIGETTAIKLLQRYGSIENILKNVDELPDKVRRCLIGSERDIELSRVLGTIVTDYSKINFTMDMLSDNSARNPKSVFSLIHYLELYSLTDTMRFDLLPPLIGTAD